MSNPVDPNGRKVCNRFKFLSGNSSEVQVGKVDQLFSGEDHGLVSIPATNLSSKYTAKIGFRQYISSLLVAVWEH